MGDIRTGQGLVKHWALTVVVECTNCGSTSTLMLINQAQVECQKCGAVHQMSSFRWDAAHPEHTAFGIGASEPRIKLATH